MVLYYMELDKILDDNFIFGDKIIIRNIIYDYGSVKELENILKTNLVNDDIKNRIFEIYHTVKKNNLLMRLIQTYRKKKKILDMVTNKYTIVHSDTIPFIQKHYIYCFLLDREPYDLKIIRGKLLVSSPRTADYILNYTIEIKSLIKKIRNLKYKINKLIDIRLLINTMNDSYLEIVKNMDQYKQLNKIFDILQFTKLHNNIYVLLMVIYKKNKTLYDKDCFNMLNDRLYDKYSIYMDLYIGSPDITKLLVNLDTIRDVIKNMNDQFYNELYKILQNMYIDLFFNLNG